MNSNGNGHAPVYTGENLDPLREAVELRLLSCIEIDERILDDPRVSCLKETDFTYTKWGNVFEAARNLHARGERADLATIASELKLMKVYVNPVEMVKIINPSPLENVNHLDFATYAADIKEHARLKEVKRLASALLNVTTSDAVAAIAGQLTALTTQTTQPAPITLTKTRDVLTRPKPVYLYPAEIPGNALITLTGASGHGKTFVAIDYALTIAQDHKVLYVAAERPYAALMRGCAWLDHHKKNDDNLLWLEKAPNLTDKGEVQALTKTIKDFGAAFVVIDTFSRCADGINEDSNSEVKRVMQTLDNIRRDTGAAVMIVHHTGWGGGRERGASAMRDYAEVAILIELDGEGVITITCNKMSNADEFERRQMRLIAVGDQAVAIAADGVATSAADKLTTKQLKVLDVMSWNIFEVGAKVKTVIELTGLPSNTVYAALRKFKRDGLVTQATTGDPYFITPQGRAKLPVLPTIPKGHNGIGVTPITDTTTLLGSGSNGNGMEKEKSEEPSKGKPVFGVLRSDQDALAELIRIQGKDRR